MKEYITKQMLILSAVITVVILVCIFVMFFIQTSAQPTISPDDVGPCTGIDCPS